MQVALLVLLMRELLLIEYFFEHQFIIWLFLYRFFQNYTRMNFIHQLFYTFLFPIPYLNTLLISVTSAWFTSSQGMVKWSKRTFWVVHWSCKLKLTGCCLAARGSPTSCWIQFNYAHEYSPLIGFTWHARGERERTRFQIQTAWCRRISGDEVEEEARDGTALKDTLKLNRNNLCGVLLQQ